MILRKMLSEILERVNLENLTKYILYGHDEVEIFNDRPDLDYNTRLNYAFEQYCEEINKKFPVIDMNNESAFLLVTDMLTLHDEIYTEIGLQAGIKLVLELYTKECMK